MPPALLAAYRLFAYVTGVALLTLTVVSAPYWVTGRDTPEWLAILWTMHGWAYIGYVLTGFTVGYRMRWTPWRIVLVLLAGTIPAMSFVAERWVVARVREAQAAESAAA